MAHVCWEQQLTANSDPANGNPYRDVDLTVTFTKDSASFVVHAFWKTGRNYAFRASFTPGTWTWSTTCQTLGCFAVGGLHGQTGVVGVSASRAPSGSFSPFYEHGPLQARYSGPYPPGPAGRPWVHPEHWDTTPFFWHGDAAWAATLRARHGEWKAYVDERKERGVTVVQLGLGATWAGEPAVLPFAGQMNNAEYDPKDPANHPGPQAPFEQVQGCTVTPAGATIPNNCSRWNIRFWERLAQMVQYANDQWVLVLIAGLADPTGQCNNSGTSCPQANEAATFARNLTSLLAGNHVVLSPGWDSRSEHQALIDAVAPSIYRHLKTNHFGTWSAAAYAAFHEQSWLGFQLLQTGHNSGNTESLTYKARWMPPVLRGWPDPDDPANSVPVAFASTKKALINGEGIYDYGYDPLTEASAFNHFRARQVGWLSWLTGARGYTWGASGNWDWGICNGSPPPYAVVDCEESPVAKPTYRDWCNAMPAIKQVDRLAGKMRELDWYQIRQNEQYRIKNQNALEQRKMAVARFPDHVVAYLPHNPSIKLDLAGTGVNPVAGRQLWKPVFGGETRPDPAYINHGSGVYEYSNPGGATGAEGGDEWVLLLSSSTSREMTWGAPGDLALDATATQTSTGTAAVQVQLVESSGTLIGQPIRIVESGPVAPARIRAARDGRGEFVVAWEHRDSVTSPSRIRLALLDRAIKKRQAQPVIPAPDNGSDQRHPTPAADASGRFFVAWEEPLGMDAPALRLLPFDRFGFALGPVLSVTSVEPGTLITPRATCAPNGRCALAWVHTSSDGRGSSIRVQPIDVAGNLDGLDFEVVPPDPGVLWLVYTAERSAGGIELRWERFSADDERSLGVHRVVVDHAGHVLEPASLFAAPAVEP